MDWNNFVWLYCERGTSAVFLAEPVNAVSNIAFLVAALAALWIYRKLPFAQKSADHTLFVTLTLVVGLGSLAFHLFASQWSELLHMLPLLLFVMVYLAFALNRFLEVPPGWTVLIVGLFVVLSMAALTMTCSFIDAAMQPPWSVGRAAQGGGATSCLNGSGGYLPSLLVFIILALWLRARGHKAAGSLMLASFVFAVSLGFHTVDHMTCKQLVVQGHAFGSHFAWHVLNALVLFILMRAAMVHQNARAVQEIIPPDLKRAKNSE